ncbi:MAG TPA: hypothetical protein VD947_04780 [Patescibacteria group bacterium]|nr:hypothetical protein [Patescibacteria group bacterium]
MRLLHRPRSKKAWIAILVCIVILIGSFYFYQKYIDRKDAQLQKDNTTSKPAKENKNKVRETPKASELPTKKPSKNPCDLVNSEIIEKLVGADATKQESPSEQGNNYIGKECLFYKDKTTANIRLREYDNEQIAKSELSNQNLLGDVAKSKGKYIVYVNVSSNFITNTDASNQILDMAVEKL